MLFSAWWQARKARCRGLGRRSTIPCGRPCVSSKTLRCLGCGESNSAAELGPQALRLSLDVKKTRLVKWGGVSWTSSLYRCCCVGGFSAPKAEYGA